MTEFPALTKLERGALGHLVNCPAENTVSFLAGWSTFAGNDPIGRTKTMDDRKESQ